MRYIIWLPGYAVIALAYFLPTEWGKNRNVTRSGRWWTHRDKLAPVLSVAIYVVIIIALAPRPSAETLSRGASTQPTLPTSTVSVPVNDSDSNATNKTNVEPMKLVSTETASSSPAATLTVVSPDAKGDEVAAPILDSRTKCAKAREDVERLEKEKQYSGDDEVVRARMGLPPRPKCPN